MKQIPLLLDTAYQRQTRGTCFLAKIVARDCQVFAFTTGDSVLRFNDGLHDLTYVPNQSLVPQNLQSTSDLEVDNTELHGWFNDVVEDAAVAGALRSAELTLYRVAFSRLSYGAEIIAYGMVGRIEYAAAKDGSRKVEFRGLDQLLKAVRNPLYSLTCRHDFGDDKCTMPLVWEAAVVAEVSEPHMRFRVTGTTRPDNWFELGVVRFDSGPNTGIDMEIEVWETSGWVTLAFPVPHAVTVATDTRLRQDCDKTEFSCKAYGNIINMGAEHMTPVQDQSLMVPGAYIKSQGAV